MEHAAEYEFRRFLLEKQVLSAVSYPLVNWEANAIAFSHMSDPFRLWAVKYISGFSGTAIRMHQRGLWPSPFALVAG